MSCSWLLMQCDSNNKTISFKKTTQFVHTVERICCHCHKTNNIVDYNDNEHNTHIKHTLPRHGGIPDLPSFQLVVVCLDI